MAFDPSKFLAASKAAESWLWKVSFVGDRLRDATSDPQHEGSINTAFEWLMPTPGRERTNLLTSWLEHCSEWIDEHDGKPVLRIGVLTELNHELILVSDGPLKWSDIAAYPECACARDWSSAHEAAAGIVDLTLERLVRPLGIGQHCGLINDADEHWEAVKRLATHWKAIAIPPGQVSALEERICRERAKLLKQKEWKQELEGKTGKEPAKRSGRRKKTEKDSATLVVAALSKWHGYQQGGSVTNCEPATNRGLVEFGVSPNALSRFLESRGGHKKYAVACRNRTIGTLLALWNRELPGRMAELTDSESGRPEEDD